MVVMMMMMRVKVLDDEGEGAWWSLWWLWSWWAERPLDSLFIFDQWSMTITGSKACKADKASSGWESPLLWRDGESDGAGIPNHPHSNHGHRHHRRHHDRIVMIHILARFWWSGLLWSSQQSNIINDKIFPGLWSERLPYDAPWRVCPDGRRQEGGDRLSLGKALIDWLIGWPQKIVKLRSLIIFVWISTTVHCHKLGVCELGI